MDSDTDTLELQAPGKFSSKNQERIQKDLKILSEVMFILKMNCRMIKAMKYRKKSFGNSSLSQ